MRLDLEWRIPWEPGWDKERKERAAAKLVEYMTKGTVFESRTRMRVTSAKVVVTSDDIFITYVLEV